MTTACYWASPTVNEVGSQYTKHNTVQPVCQPTSHSGEEGNVLIWVTKLQFVLFSDVSAMSATMWNRQLGQSRTGLNHNWWERKPPQWGKMNAWMKRNKYRGKPKHCTQAERPFRPSQYILLIASVKSCIQVAYKSCIALYIQIRVNERKKKKS